MVIDKLYVYFYFMYSNLKEGNLMLLDRIKKENNDLYNRIADALEVNESHQKFNGKLQERLTELEQENIELQAENKKMSNHLEKQVDNARKSGM